MRPNEVETLYDWFDAMVAEKGPDTAVARLSAFTKGTRAWAPPLVLGYCLFGLGRSKVAIPAFREAYKRRRAENTLYALSGALLVTDRVDDAIELLVAHDRVKGLGARPLVNLANAYLARGDTKSAEGALQRISKKDREAWDELVDSAWQRLKWSSW